MHEALKFGLYDKALYETSGPGEGKANDSMGGGRGGVGGASGGNGGGANFGGSFSGIGARGLRDSGMFGSSFNGPGLGVGFGTVGNFGGSFGQSSNLAGAAPGGMGFGRPTARAMKDQPASYSPAAYKNPSPIGNYFGALMDAYGYALPDQWGSKTTIPGMVGDTNWGGFFGPGMTPGAPIGKDQSRVPATEKDQSRMGQTFGSGWGGISTDTGMSPGMGVGGYGGSKPGGTVGGFGGRLGGAMARSGRF